MKSSRRNFLKGIGAASLVPLLPSLLAPRQARADGVTPPLRLAIFWGFNGIHDAAYWPNPAALQQPAPGVYAAKLADIQGNISPVFGSAFDGLRSKMAIVRGLGQCVSPYGADNIVHDAASVLCCSHIPNNADPAGFSAPVLGSSLDCIVENSTSFYPTTPHLGALRIAGGPAAQTPSFWRPQGGRTPAPENVLTMEYADDDPQQVFQQVFGDFIAPKPAPDTTAYRRQVFDSLLSRYNTLAASSALSSSDKARLQNHADMMRDLKTRILNGTTVAAGCKPNTLSGGSSLVQRYDDNFDTIAAAFACDLTRLVVYDVDQFDDTGNVTWDDDHANSHESGSSLIAKGYSTDYVANCAAWRGWQANRIASFMSKLDAITDIDGVSTVLDNTIVIWTNQHGGTHCISNYPMMIGGGAGKFRMGLYLDYRSRAKGDPDDRALGRPLGNLWMAVMRALNVPASEYLKQGEDGAFGQGLRSGDAFVNGTDQIAGYPSNLAQIRRELIPYFYTGPA